MVLCFLRSLVPGPSKRRRVGNRELIGQMSYGKGSLERVPSWVLRQVGKMAQKHSSSTLGLQTFHLKGRTYRYKGAFSGQGGPTVHYYRRRRRKPS